MLGSLVGVAALWLSYSCSLPLQLYRGIRVVMRALQWVQSVLSFTEPVQVCVCVCVRVCVCGACLRLYV